MQPQGKGNKALCFKLHNCKKKKKKINRKAISSINLYKDIICQLKKKSLRKYIYLMRLETNSIQTQEKGINPCVLNYIIIVKKKTYTKT